MSSTAIASRSSSTCRASSGCSRSRSAASRSPRRYATASGVGPLLMISPYASGGALTAAASTQAGVSGFGVPVPGGIPSGGAFYWGNPSLAGDALAQLQISYVGPLPTIPESSGLHPRRQIVPYAVAALLPDANYRPLITAQQMSWDTGVITGASGAVASQYIFLAASINGNEFNFPIPASPMPLSWAGYHRLFAIARASNIPGSLQISPTLSCPNTSAATIYPGDWQIADLGTFSIRPSQLPSVKNLYVTPTWASTNAGIIDVTAIVMLPDNQSWFFNPNTLTPSQYGMPGPIGGGNFYYTPAAYSNQLLLDDISGDQFVIAGQSQMALSGNLVIPSQSRITQYSRGLVPRPDPHDGLPIIALLGVGQYNFAGSDLYGAGASWVNPQNLRTMAQVNVLERTTYVLP